MRKDKKRSRVQVSRRLIYGLNWNFDNNNNRVNFYPVQAYPDDNKKSQWKKFASKEITMEEFQSDSSAREKRFLILPLGL